MVWSECVRQRQSTAGRKRAANSAEELSGIERCGVWSGAACVERLEVLFVQLEESLCACLIGQETLLFQIRRDERITWRQAHRRQNAE